MLKGDKYLCVQVGDCTLRDFGQCVEVLNGHFLIRFDSVEELHEMYEVLSIVFKETNA